MPRPDNTIEKIRLNAWHLMGCASDKLWDPAWGGEDLLALDALACKLYRAIVSKNMEQRAVARHAFEEFYDLGPGQLPSDPYERPPEITQQLKDRGLIP